MLTPATSTVASVTETPITASVAARRSGVPSALVSTSTFSFVSTSVASPLTCREPSMSSEIEASSTRRFTVWPIVRVPLLVLHSKRSPSTRLVWLSWTVPDTTRSTPSTPSSAALVTEASTAE